MLIFLEQFALDEAKVMAKTATSYTTLELLQKLKLIKAIAALPAGVREFAVGMMNARLQSETSNPEMKKVTFEDYLGIFTVMSWVALDWPTKRVPAKKGKQLELMPNEIFSCLLDLMPEAVAEGTGV